MKQEKRWENQENSTGAGGWDGEVENQEEKQEAYAGEGGGVRVIAGEQGCNEEYDVNHSSK